MLDVMLWLKPGPCHTCNTCTYISSFIYSVYLCACLASLCYFHVFPHWSPSLSLAPELFQLQAGHWVWLVALQSWIAMGQDWMWGGGGNSKGVCIINIQRMWPNHCRITILLYTYVWMSSVTQQFVKSLHAESSKQLHRGCNIDPFRPDWDTAANSTHAHTRAGTRTHTTLSSGIRLAMGLLWPMQRARNMAATLHAWPNGCTEEASALGTALTMCYA